MPLPGIDLALLGGFRFLCRPDCGLCCFAEPAVTGEERERLVQIEPDLSFADGDHGWSFVASRPNGGACGLLTDTRCRAHAARPTPCQQFPITVHVSHRAQASLVLSCPGLDPAGVLRWASGPPLPQRFAGLDVELGAAEGEWRRSGSERELDRHQLRRNRSIGGSELGRLRASLHRQLPWPEDRDFPPEGPPEASDGYEQLPVTFSSPHTRVAFASHVGGWSLFALSEPGEEPRLLGVVPPPERLPPVTGQGEQLLRGYLHYLIERDDSIDGVLAQTAPDGSLEEAIQADLIRTGATVLARASVLQRVEGRDGPLDAADVWGGVRATDAEWLDRPTTGRRF